MEATKRHVRETAEKYGVRVIAKLPIDPECAKLVDSGLLELMETEAADPIADAVEEFCK